MTSPFFACGASVVLLSLAACQKAPLASSPGTDAQQTTASESAAGELTLKPEEVARLGIVTTPALAIRFTPEGSGYALVVGRETLAQSVAEIATAEAAARQSRAALTRVQGLAATPGAFPLETLETAQRQAAADAAALSLAQRKLSVAIGDNPAWRSGVGEATRTALATGSLKLLRVTFPFGVVTGEAPRSLRVSPLDATAAPRSWSTSQVWSAPADAAIPGRSFFALLNTSEIGEGERLQAWVPTGAAESGVLVPAAAIVISEGRYWCYVEKEPSRFERVEVDVSRPVSAGYQVRDRVAAGDAIVTSAAGLLLARETNPGTDAG